MNSSSLAIFGFIALGISVAQGQEQDMAREGAPNNLIEEPTTSSQSWIRRNDSVDPAIWLASREAGRLVARDDPSVGRIRKAFKEAAPKFLESERMVANRTAQLAEMLSKDGKPESTVDIIEGLSSVVGAEKGKETFGELCQFYFILRHNGADRAAVLTDLRKRYGPPATDRSQKE